MKHYLYGLTIHSIQGYVFQTKKLKEIAGASELVEQICTTQFSEMIEKIPSNLKIEDLAIRNAAGNVRYLFSNENACREIVKNIPKKILEFAPGVLISQAVVGIEDIDNLNENDFLELEKRLTAQRNNPIRPVDLGYLAINRSRLTGLPSVERINSLGEVLINDRATKLKQRVIDNHKHSRVNDAFFHGDYTEDMIPIDAEKIVSSKNPDYRWLAVIHADGNNMGRALQNLNAEPNAKKNYGDASKIFSRVIDESTKAAAYIAFKEAYPINPPDCNFIPFRPIIVGGDDLIIICRADLALVFTKSYLEAFEYQTKEKFIEAKFNTLKDGLTACAGIAYIKVNYPFHYAADLAETLCNHAKKISKTKPDKNGLTPSCLMFHKVQDSFVENYTDIIDRELTAHASECSFDYGPYFTDEKCGDKSINKLIENVHLLEGKEGNAIKSSLRQWLTDLHYNKAMAEQRMKRLLSVGKPKILTGLGLNEVSKGIYDGKSPVYDWLTILSINQNNDNDDDN